MLEWIVSLLLLLSPVEIAVPAGTEVTFLWIETQTVDQALSLDVAERSYTLSLRFQDVCLIESYPPGQWQCRYSISTPVRYQTGKKYEVMWRVNDSSAAVFWADTSQER